jgi:predicted nucleic acid-binding protein
MRILFDTNIVLDILLGRIPWHAEASAIFEFARREELKASVTTLCIANVFYIGRRLAGLEKAEQSVRDCLAAFEVLAVNRHTLETAIQLAGSDFEDKIQIAVAMEAQLDGIVTRDPTGFSASPITAYSPGELLKKLTS